MPKQIRVSLFQSDASSGLWYLRLSLRSIIPLLQLPEHVSDGTDSSHMYIILYCYRPGFVRLNLPYFMSDEEIEFVIEAVKMVASDGWKLLPR